MLCTIICIAWHLAVGLDSRGLNKHSGVVRRSIDVHAEVWQCARRFYLHPGPVKFDTSLSTPPMWQWTTRSARDPRITLYKASV